MNDQMPMTGLPEGDDELERLLDAYARSRLAPDPARTARLRVEILIRAAEIRAAEEAEVLSGATVPLLERARRRRRLGRLLPTLLAAALAGLLVSGVAYAGSQAGGPLYAARIWLEDATLPADPDARLDAQLAHLQARLDEARAATASGNGGAVQAALDAYRATVDETLATADGQLDRSARLGLVLERHVFVLTALHTELPAGAASAIEQAIDRTEQRIKQIQQAGPGNPGGGPPETPGSSAGDGADGKPVSSPPGGLSKPSLPAAQPSDSPDHGPGSPKPSKSPKP